MFGPIPIIFDNKGLCTIFELAVLSFLVYIPAKDDHKVLIISVLYLVAFSTILLRSGPLLKMTISNGKELC